MKPPIIQEDVAQELFERWVDRLALHSYQITLTYERVVADTPDHRATLCAEPGGFDFFVSVAWTDDFDQLAGSIVHELLHIWFHLPPDLNEALPALPRKLIDSQIEHGVRSLERFIMANSIFDDTDLKEQC